MIANPPTSQNFELTTLEPATSIIPSGAQYVTCTLKLDEEKSKHVTCTLKLDEEKSKHAGLGQRNGYRVRGWSTTHKGMLSTFYTLVRAK
jgi:hypothetical protein